VAQRPVDKSVSTFLKATGATIGALVVLQVWIAIVQKKGPNEAFLWSIAVVLAMVGLILFEMKRRPADKDTSWGEAMAGATFVFMLMFIAYGVLPHQFLVYADSELLWRSDRFLFGPDIGLPGGERLFEYILPFDLTYLVIRDIIAVVIYGILLVGHVALFSMWQRRGAVAPAGTDTVDRSKFGRPLVRQGVRN